MVDSKEAKHSTRQGPQEAQPSPVCPVQVTDTAAFKKAVRYARKRRMGWGLFFKILGLIFIVGSLSLYAVNQNIEKRRGSAAADVLEQLAPALNVDKSSEPSAAKAKGLPLVTIGDYPYCGVVEIPDLDLKLPVIQGFTMDKMEIAPCCYTGSPYDDHFVICAHNSITHFGKLPQLAEGAEIIFRDFDHKRWTYRLAEAGVYPDTAIAEIKSDQWDLTLFTCTNAGIARYAVRCSLVQTESEEEPPMDNTLTVQ